MATQYFLIQIHANLNDEIQLSKAQNHSLSLPHKLQRKLKNYENQTHKAILFDLKQNYVSIWGWANVTFGKNMSKNTPYVQTSNFTPISDVVNGKIKSKWLPERFGGSTWSKNRKIRPISEKDYREILNSVVDSRDLFTGSMEDIEETSENKETITSKKITSADEEHDSISYGDDLSLEIPNKELLEQGIRKIQNLLLVDKKTIEEIVIHLTSGRHILLAGPIGTGKTRLAELIPKLFWTNRANGYDTKIHTASYEWNVHDVIGGIVPRMKDDRPSYQIQYGCVTETVQKSWNDKNNPEGQFSGTWLVIDEFNRAEIDKAFGQLFTSLESKSLLIPDAKTPTLKELKIPKDYRIIGTLNTSDKHYLFKLSDALKRRFAYVELKSPPRNHAEQEIYYALMNAIDELPSSSSSLIALDDNTKKLSKNQTNPELVSAIRSAYEILSFVRMTKDMGTAILKTIYQTMLIGTQIKGYSDSVLDIALSGNLIPQLEKVEITNIEVLSKFCFDDVFSFFRRMYDAQDDETRQQFSNDFESFLKFLEIPESEKLRDNYQRKNVADESWQSILEAWNLQKSKNALPRNLPLFKTALDDLKKTFGFL